VTAASTQTTVTDAWVDAFTTGDPDAVIACYAPDVVIDMNVPQWRFQVQGRAAAREVIVQEEFVPGRHATFVAKTLTEDGFLVELECRAEMHGEEHLWRSIHRLVVEGSFITEHVAYCTGIWDAETIERQQVEAPMVRAW